MGEEGGAFGMTRSGDWVTHLVLGVGVVLFALPLWLVVAGSTQPAEAIARGELSLVPDLGRLGVYGDVLANGDHWSPVWRMLLVSFGMAMGIAVGKIVVSVLSAFAVVFFRWRGRTLAFSVIFLTLMLPVEPRVIPTYAVMGQLGLINSMGGLILPLIASATATLLFRQVFGAVPDELVEAARMDGAGPLRFLRDILLPVSAANVAALFVILFVYGWNQYLWPLVVAADPKLDTVVIGIVKMIGTETGDGLEPGDGDGGAGVGGAGGRGGADAAVVRQRTGGGGQVMATLALEGLRKSFGAVDILKGVDLTLADGEMLAIVGASGCGKSTLLRLVAGLETATSGQISIDGRDVTGEDPSRRDIAMVFQNYALYPHMSVFDNMAYGLRIRGVSREAIRSKVGEAAGLLGIGALLERKPRQLSGGQRQRVAMGRAIVRDPKLFLFDEPLSNLDATLRVQMRGEIRKLQRRLGVTSLFVTHDQVEAMTLGDRLLVLHQGVPVQLASPMEVFLRPATTYVAGFIGAPAMNLVPGELVEGGVLVLGMVVPVACGRRVGPVTVGVRPEDVRLVAGGAAMAVELVEPLGSETLVHGRMGDGVAVTCKLPGAPMVAERVSVGFVGGAVHLFDAGSGVRL